MLFATTIILLAFALWAIVRMHECGGADSLWEKWKKLDFPARAASIIAVVFFTLIGGTKGPAPIVQVLRLLFWDHPATWALSETTQKTQAAIAANGITEAALAEVEAATNEIVTLSFDWHVPNRLPYHERQNVLAWTATVVPTNIGGVMHEDHYVAFNAMASTNPAVILIEYAGKREDGTIERYSAPVVTNSYPDTSVVTLQSGAYTCYWFRVAVPVAFTNAVRDWNGEALFGSPAGSGKGFDLLGTLVIDDGNDVWVGATTNHVFGSSTNVFKNGINITEVSQ